VLDRDPDQPDLVAMTRSALERMSTHSGGFVLVVEGARIDHAGHANDAAAAAREVLEFDETVRLARDFARRDGGTLVVATADHETGGLSLGASVGETSLYEFRAEVLHGVRTSAGRMAERVDAGEPVANVLAEGAGLDDLAAAELELIASAAAGSDRELAIARLISRRAVVGWTTLGHTAVDVPVAAFGPGAGRFRGHRHLADIGLEMAALLGLDIEGTTRER
jgi:alkaline phosphatase